MEIIKEECEKRAERSKFSCFMDHALVPVVLAVFIFFLVKVGV